ncbi:LON peptidase substrate-binding domain-containing protein [Comamonas sp. Y33R10-2]|uniref:LON peptidase substrate-binding domain-containing protein n=1 Tax=Comamonas sp. Y33R10-2 TaxID=2853257 RepID=UPI001C5CBBC5|nr:LON peptidase substrate-binding domain-containing protein [Comamonas sp. Y33R10-2]QXZ10109.1 LON peptidase substrate-binding domain-containing protein [Comamonas sp. Y33R10-2]
MTDTQSLHSLPLFPLNTVLLPEGLLSLQVFEVRYLDMARKCQQTGAPFGVVALQSGQEVRKAGSQTEQLHAEGVLAHITQLDSPQPGLLHLQCKGSQRFHIQHCWQLPHGLWVADVNMLPADSHIAVPPHLRSTAYALAQALLNVHGSDPEHAQLPTFEQMQDCAWVANRWTEMLPLPVRIKQQLMTLDSPLLRLELIADVLDQSGIAGTPSTKN